MPSNKYELSRLCHSAKISCNRTVHIDILYFTTLWNLNRQIWDPLHLFCMVTKLNRSKYVIARVFATIMLTHEHKTKITVSPHSDCAPKSLVKWAYKSCSENNYYRLYCRKLADNYLCRFLCRQVSLPGNILEKCNGDDTATKRTILLGHGQELGIVW